MAENSKIAWTDHTFNPWIGCTRVSPGCQNCYAENLMANRYGRVKWGPGQKRVRTKTWKDPEKWNREAAATGVRKKVFCASLADWLDEEVDQRWRDELCALIDRCPNLDWLMLTKRPAGFSRLIPLHWLDNWPANVWFGVTAENQKYYDERVAQASIVPAAIHWVSYEPALGQLSYLRPFPDHEWLPDWLIIGGESAQGEPVREFDIDWAIEAVALCRYYGVAPFVKQIGSNATKFGERLKTKDRAGADPDEWPKEIRVREFPELATR